MRNSSFLVRILLLTLPFLTFSSVAIGATSDLVPDTENCLLCHRYPHIGRYDEDGNKRIFYVNEQLFAGSVHGTIKCKDCHTGLDKIPHTDVKKVECATKCHTEEPSTKQQFSHQKVMNIYEASSHGTGIPKNPKNYVKDLPTCKYCHDNRILNPMGDMWSKDSPLARETTGRCFGCHTEKQWAERFYSHVSHRMRPRRSQVEIVELCLSCHENREMMARHGLRTVETFRDTFHWVQIKYGVKNAPDCLNCHVPIGNAEHDILTTSDPRSPINPANRINTCRHQGGVQICHPTADAAFVAGREHAFGMDGPVAQYAGENIIQVRSKAWESARQAEIGISDTHVLQEKILTLVRIFYKILIAFVIGSMTFHQMLDYYRTKRSHKNGR
jgi:hypothetical protein